MHDLGGFIRDQRRMARLSLRKLSELAGISNPYLSQIERGLRPRRPCPGSIRRFLSPTVGSLVMPLRSVAVLSLHTSPVAQPGVGDGGGMNIYVRSLSSALARAGVACDVYTRAEHPGQPRVVTVEPNLRVFNVPAGPASPVPKESLPGLVDEFTESMLGQIRGCG